MTPEIARAWLRVLRDTLSLGLGIFMCVYGTLVVADVQRLTVIFGTGVFLCGLPVAFRWPLLFDPSKEGKE